MPQEKFKAGQIVRLKSGGPKMTVQGYVHLGMDVYIDDVRCKWFVGNADKVGDFHEDSLELDDDDE